MKTLHRVFICCAVIISMLLLYNTSQAMNFDFAKADQINQWKDLAGTMAIKDGLLCSVKDAGGPLVSMVKDWKDEWSDYTITVKAQGLVADADWGISFRIKDIANFYSWQFCNGSLQFITYVGGARTEAWKVVQAEVLNQTQDYKVDVKGSAFDLYLNGKLIQSVKHDALKTGSVGTFVWINGGTALGNHGGVSFDDFNVDGKGIPGALTPVTPQAHISTTWGDIKSAY